MMELSFKVYLIDYVQRLSYCESTDVGRLANEACTNNSRLYAVLILYAIFTDKTDLLLQYLNSKEFKQYHAEWLEDVRDKYPVYYLQRKKEDNFAQYCADFFLKYNKNNIEQLLIEKSELLELEYHKCWESYNVRKNLLKKHGEKLSYYARYQEIIKVGNK